VWHLFRACYHTQGDFFREAGITNYRNFNPDSTSFNSSGWGTFMKHLITQPDREDTLTRMGHLLLNKICLLASKVKPVAVEAPLTGARPAPVTINLKDVSGKIVRIQLGNKIFEAHEVSEAKGANSLVARAVAKIEASASAQLGSYAEEFSETLKRLHTQHKSTVRELKARADRDLPTLDIPSDLLATGIQVSGRAGYYDVFLPIRLHYKYLATPWHVWELDKEYQCVQHAKLWLILNREFYYNGAFLRDKYFKDTVQLWHSGADEVLCLGSYGDNMRRIDKLEDTLKVRDDIQRLLQIINTDSMQTENLRGKQRELENKIEGASWADFDDMPGDLTQDMDFSEVASLKSSKGEGGVIWTT